MQVDNLKDFSKLTNGKLIFDYDLKKLIGLTLEEKPKHFLNLKI